MEKGLFRFLPEEVKEMEERLFPVTIINRRLDHVLMDELAVKFSYSRGLAGITTPVKSKQVHIHTYMTSSICASIDVP